MLSVKVGDFTTLPNELFCKKGAEAVNKIFAATQLKSTKAKLAALILLDNVLGACAFSFCSEMFPINVNS